MKLPKDQIVLVAASFLILGFVYPVWLAFSIYLPSISTSMGWGRAIVSGSLAILIITNAFSSPFSGRLCDKFGTKKIIRIGGLLLGVALLSASWASSPWHFYLFFGFLGGLGVALGGWVPAVTAITRQSRQWLATKTAVASMGIGVGMLLAAPLVHRAIELWGWRRALLIEGGIIFVGIQIAAAFIPERKSGGMQPAGEEEELIEEKIKDVARVVFRLKEFWLVLIVFLCFNFGIQMLQIHQVAFLIDAKWDPKLAAYVVSIIGLASLPVKALLGISSDRIGREVTFTLGFVSLVSAIFVLRHLSLNPDELIGLFIYAILFSIAYSIIAPLFPAIASDLFSGPNYGSVYGLLTVGASTGSALGVYGAGIIFDLTESYFIGILLALILGLISTFAVWIAAPRMGHPANYTFGVVR